MDNILERKNSIESEWHIKIVLYPCKYKKYILANIENGNPFQSSCLENSMGVGAWQAAVRGVSKSRTWLSTHALQINTQPSLNLLRVWRSVFLEGWTQASFHEKVLSFFTNFMHFLSRTLKANVCFERADELMNYKSLYQKFKNTYKSMWTKVSYLLSLSWRHSSRIL